MTLTCAGRKLKKMINRAIEDHVITNKEYEEIINTANEDFYIDRNEKALLAQLHEMIANKQVKRVAG